MHGLGEVGFVSWDFAVQRFVAVLAWRPFYSGLAFSSFAAALGIHRIFNSVTGSG
jgi:hypothetical protein